jgi:hypothetical protein
MKKTTRVYMYLLCANVVILAVLIIMALFAKDPSFLTKFLIIEKTFDFYRNADLRHILFGVGFGNTVNYFNMGAHNFIVTYLVESGICGLLLLCILWIGILRKTRFEAAIVMVPFLINSMSLAGHAISYLYAIFGIIYILANRKPDIQMQLNSLGINKIFRFVQLKSSNEFLIR